MSDSQSSRVHRTNAPRLVAKRRVAVVILGLLVLVSVGGALPQVVAAAYDRMTVRPPGNIINIAGAGLHVYCSGPDDASPVFLVTGMGVVSDSWTRVHEDLAQDHRVCRYDRAGTGHSDPFEGAKDAGAAADRLAVLSEAIGIEGPMVVAGHSYGGLVARVFAHRYPERVAGLVLVDSAHEEMEERLPPRGRAMVDDILNSFGILGLANRFGILRVVGVPSPLLDGLDGEARRRAAAVYSSVPHMRAAAEEAAAWRDGTSTQLGQAIDSFGEMPMTVLVADDYPDDLVPHWLALHRDLARLSSGGRILVISGSDHFGLIQRPEYATQVAAEIRALSGTWD